MIRKMFIIPDINSIIKSIFNKEKLTEKTILKDIDKEDEEINILISKLSKHQIVLNKEKYINFYYDKKLYLILINEKGDIIIKIIKNEDNYYHFFIKCVNTKLFEIEKKKNSLLKELEYIKTKTDKLKIIDDFNCLKSDLDNLNERFNFE